MQDLVNTTVPAATLTAMKQDLTDARTKFAPHAVGLTTDQRSELFKMGDKSVAFVDKTATFLTEYPDYTPRRVNPAQFASDLALFNSLMPLRTQAAAFLQMVDDTMMAAGSDLMEVASAYYRSVQDAAEDGDSVAKKIFEELQKRFPYKGVRDTPANPTTPDTPANPTS